MLSAEELKALMDEQDGWRVSIFMPTHRAGAEIQQDPIRLKNLLNQAENELEAVGLDEPEIQAILEPALDLVSDTLFWQHQSEGLALFLNAEATRVYRLPARFDPLAVVAQRFHIKPLLPLLSGDGRFYLLTLSQENIELYEGSRYSLRQLTLEDVPESLAALLREEDRERYVQFHTNTQPAPRRGHQRAAIFHGHGIIESDAKDDILRYFRRVDHALQDFLHDKRAPLILVGVDYLIPIYEEANSYPYLVEEAAINKHPTALDTPDLHTMAWSQVEPRFLTEQLSAVALYRQLSGGGSERASADLNKVVPAAHHARIDTVFVAQGTQRWGTFDAASGTVTLNPQPQPGDEDLLDQVAVHTIINGGTVYAVASEKMPEAEAPVAAILRY